MELTCDQAFFLGGGGGRGRVQKWDSARVWGSAATLLQVTMELTLIDHTVGLPRTVEHQSPLYFRAFLVLTKRKAGSRYNIVEN